MAKLYKDSRLIWIANSERYLDLLARYNALALLLPSGRYLVTPETAANDLSLIRGCTHEDVEILMQQEEKLHSTRYERLKKQLLNNEEIMALYRKLSGYKDITAEPDNIIFNDLVAKAFELLFIIDEYLVYPNTELTKEEREFIRLMRPILEAKDSRGLYKNFSQVFFDFDRRAKVIQVLQEDKGERFYRVASTDLPEDVTESPTKIDMSRVDQVIFEVIPGISIVPDHLIGYMQEQDNIDPESATVPPYEESQRQHIVDIVTKTLSDSVPLFNSMTTEEKNEVLRRMLTAGNILFPESKVYKNSNISRVLYHELFHRIYAANPQIKTMGDKAFETLFNDGQIRFQLRIMFQGSSYWRVHFTDPDEFWAQYFYPSHTDSFIGEQWQELRKMMTRLISSSSKEANEVSECLEKLRDEVLPQVQAQASELFIRVEEVKRHVPKMAQVIIPESIPEADNQTKEIGNSATLLRYMFANGIDKDHSLMPQDMAKQRGGNDSLSNIYRELAPLERAGIVEGGKGQPRYLADWVLALGPEEIIRQNPELNRPALHEDEAAMEVVASRTEQAKRQALSKTNLTNLRSILHDIGNIMFPLLTAHEYYKEHGCPVESLNEAIAFARRRKKLFDDTHELSYEQLRPRTIELARDAQHILTSEYLSPILNSLFEQLPAKYKTERGKYYLVDFVFTCAILGKNLLAELLSDSERLVKPVNLNDVIESTLPHSALIMNCAQKDYRAGNVTLLTDEVALSRALLNIVVNASHALGTASKQERVFRIVTSIDGEYVVIAMTDNGEGIPAEIIDKIFDPHFTTKAQGSGLGLAIAKENIEKRCMGTIEVQSELGKGTTFTIRLPIKHEQTPSPDAGAVKEAFDTLNGEARKVSQLNSEISRLRGTSQNLMEVTKYRFCVPVRVLKNSPDITHALNTTGLLRQRGKDSDKIEFELVVTGVTDEDLSLIEGLNREDIRKALDLPEKFTVSTISERQMQETASRFSYDITNPKHRVAIVKDFFSGTLANGEYMAIATDALGTEDDADRLQSEIEKEFKQELFQENISVRVLVGPERGKSMFSLSKIINDWLEAINQGNLSSIAKILPVPAPLTPELERATKEAWAVLTAA